MLLYNPTWMYKYFDESEDKIILNVEFTATRCNGSTFMECFHAAYHTADMAEMKWIHGACEYWFNEGKRQEECISINIFEFV